MTTVPHHQPPNHAGFRHEGRTAIKCRWCRRGYLWWLRPVVPSPIDGRVRMRRQCEACDAVEALRPRPGEEGLLCP